MTAIAPALDALLSLSIDQVKAEAEAERHQPPSLAAVQSFRDWLPYWRFVNRETGELLSFGDPETGELWLWEGQRAYAEAMDRYPMTVALKAGKLGFTELAVARRAYRLIKGSPRSRVHLFSKDQPASFKLLDYVRDGIKRLPGGWGIQVMGDMPARERPRGADIASQFIVHADWMQPDDRRTVVSYPAVRNVSIDDTCQDAMVDELAAMQWGDAVMDAVLSTVAPGGSLDVLSRGHGPDNRMAKLWASAKAGGSRFHPVFARYDARPGRGATWRAALEASGEYTTLGLRYFAPETEEDALAGDAESIYIPLDLWDRLRAPIPDLDATTPIVLALDAGVSSDCFAAVAVSRHPDRPGDACAVRWLRLWHPPRGGAHLDFDAIEQELRAFITTHNTVQVVYDPYQLEDMSQRFRREGLSWVNEMSQGGERLEADAALYVMAVQGRLAHDGDPDLREHIGNARVKLYADDDSKKRIVKAAPELKVDLVVSLSMAAKRCMYLALA